MDAVQWAPVVSAAVAVLGGAASLFGWWQSRGERKEAAKSADTAAGALHQIAALQTQRDEREHTRAVAEERDPWSIEPISGTEANLVNNTETPKYGIKVLIYTGDLQPHNLFAEENFAFVGPRRSAGISYINLSAQITAIITWHLREDQTDEQPRQIITW